MADKLGTYRKKRDFAATPEPAGDAAGGEDARRFVIQEHHATRLHWDLRLERDGTLVSFAVPNGLPEEPKDNRLAVHTEDHPLEYLEFEGEIPKGSYGAGTMRVWDRGTYDELKWEPRKIEVALHGERVEGRYALFPLDKGEDPKDWMIHRMDPPADPSREPMPDKIVPMMARLGPLPDDDERWAHEIKWDGVRAIAHSEPGRLRFHSRNLHDITPRYPELSRLNRALSHHRAILDGEIVALDAEGKPSFGALQRRMHLTSESQVRRLAKEAPVTYMIFDLLWLDGHSLMALPYTERRARLAELELEGPRWRAPEYVAGRGADMLAATEAQGLEGIVAKRLDAPYEPGRRSPCWVKVKNVDRQEVVVGGWMPGEGRRVHRGRARPPPRAARAARARQLPVRRARAGDAAARGGVGRAAPRGRGRVPRVDAGRPAARAVVQGAARRQGARGRRARRRGGREPSHHPRGQDRRDRRG